MTPKGIIRVSGEEAYDLISPTYLSMLPLNDQETMRRYIMNSTRIWMSFTEEEISGCCGLIPPTLLSDQAYLWLYTTEHVAEHTFTFIRYSQRVLEEALREFPRIIGHTEASNTKAIRWIKWLGGVYGEPIGRLIPFEIRAKHG